MIAIWTRLYRSVVRLINASNPWVMAKPLTPKLTDRFQSLIKRKWKKTALFWEWELVNGKKNKQSASS